MKLSRPARKIPPETIIPLIDIVFFLLIFFMLIGRMDATAPFDVTPATAENGADMPGGGATISIGANGETALNGAATERAAILEKIREILQENPAKLIRINAHKNTPLQYVLPLVALVEALGARDVVLVVTPSEP